MKKSIIAAGAASVALAAMPIVGAFATTSVKDSITATIGAGCTITNTADAESQVSTNTVTMTTTPGQSATSSTSAGISFVCNSDSWAVSAVAAGAGANATSLYNGSNEIATGTATSGDTSAWAFKIAEAANASIETDYANFAAVPATATKVVSGSAAATTTVKPQYQIFAAENQVSGNYVGAVTYTVAVVE